MYDLANRAFDSIAYMLVWMVFDQCINERPFTDAHSIIGDELDLFIEALDKCLIDSDCDLISEENRHMIDIFRESFIRTAVDTGYAACFTEETFASAVERAIKTQMIVTSRGRCTTRIRDFFNECCSEIEIRNNISNTN